MKSFQALPTTEKIPKEAPVSMIFRKSKFFEYVLKSSIVLMSGNKKNFTFFWFDFDFIDLWISSINGGMGSVDL